MMKCILTAIIIISCTEVFGQTLPAKSPCLTDKIYRQFDFWIGDWEVYNIKEKKAGDSKITLILDSCIVLEEWTSVVLPGVPSYTGKSFNTYDATSKQWQQTWVDNVGGSTHYIFGKYEKGKIIFQTSPSKTGKDTIVVMRLSFFDLGPDKVRQLGEISNDNGQTWSTQYDLEYRRKK